MQLHTNYDLLAFSHADETPWVPSPMKGVDRKMLERNGGEVARATSIVRYAAGSYFSPHVHTGGEEFIVLDGVFSDEHGDYGAGMYVRNPVGSKHKPFSKDGCVIMVKLWQYPADDQEFVRIDMTDQAPWQQEETGLARLALHHTAYEAVEVLKISKGQALSFAEEGGTELFVLDGQIEHAGTTYGKWDWLRFPVDMSADVRAVTDVILWKKTGHLLAPPPLPTTV